MHQKWEAWEEDLQVNDVETLEFGGAEFWVSSERERIEGVNLILCCDHYLQTGESKTRIVLLFELLNAWTTLSYNPTDTCTVEFNLFGVNFTLSSQSIERFPLWPQTNNFLNLTFNSWINYNLDQSLTSV